MNKRENFNLARLFIAVTLVCIAVWVLGPYDYHIYSMEGMVYYFFVNFLFFLGLCCGNVTLNGINKSFFLRKNIGNLNLSRKGEVILIIFVVISYICFLFWVYDFIKIVGTNYIFASGDFRNSLSENRSNISRLAEMGMHSGVAAYLLICSFKNTNYKSTKGLAFISLWLPGVANLFIGTRWKVIVSILLYYFANKQYVSLQFLKSKISGKLIKRIILALGFGVIVYIVMNLFNTRGNVDSPNEYLFTYGDMKLKGFYENIYFSTNGVLRPLYKLSKYVSHHFAVFSELYNSYMPNRIYYGAYALRLLSYIFNAIGIPFFNYKDIVNSVFSGMYSGFVYYFIVDFGLIGTPIVVFLIGIVMSKLYNKKDTNIFARSVAPIIASMVVCAPIYYFLQVGALDYVIFWVCLLYIVTKLFSHGT